MREVLALSGSLLFLGDEDVFGDFEGEHVAVEQAVVLLLEVVVRAAVQGELAALAEGLCAAVDPADEWLLVGVCVLMLPKVLGQREGLRAKLAVECFHLAVDVVVPLERELGREALAALGELAFKD